MSYKDFYWINNELYNYYVWSYMGRYFDSRYSDDTRIIFRERDSGPRTMEIVAISKHSQQEWELNVNDDDVRVCTYEGGRAAGIFNDDDDSITSTNWRPASWKSNYSFGPDHEVPAVHNDLWIRKEH